MSAKGQDKEGLLVNAEGESAIKLHGNGTHAPSSDDAKQADPPQTDESLTEREGNEANSIKQNTNPYLLPPPPKMGFFKLFRYASCNQKAKMAIGGIAAVGNGFLMPMFILIFGGLTNELVGKADPYLVGKYSILFLLLGVVAFLLMFTQLICWMTVGEEISVQIRKKYFAAILRQDIGWFDTINPNELASKVATDCFSIQQATGEKIAQFLQQLFMILGGFIIGYTRGWEMALVVSCILPLQVLLLFAFIKLMTSVAMIQSRSYAQSGALAEQAINSIKTVKSLCGQEFEAERYAERCKKAFSATVNQGVKLGIGLGALFFVMFADYALGLWYGSTLIIQEYENDPLCNDAVIAPPATVKDGMCDFENWRYNVGRILTIFFSILMSGFALGSITPMLTFFTKGVEAGKRIFQIIDNTPLIGDDPSKYSFEKIEGDYRFENVKFKYPMKQDITVLKGVTINFEKFKKTALVGESGCGKSTIMQLLQRFYDPDEGTITVDGKNLSELYLRDYRQHIGYVGQEPVLFAATIRENLSYGDDKATEEQMIHALKQANAWDFISKLDDKLDTDVGVSGGQFSGGQKQRICIARAILKNPTILLLDEATSALDRRNEAEIQQTLDHVAQGRTSIIIAHRLTTIQNADMIYVMDLGEVAENGTHTELISKGGRYEALAKNQLAAQTEDGDKIVHEEITLKRKQSVLSFIDENGKTTILEDVDYTGKKKTEKITGRERIQLIRRLQVYNRPDCCLAIIGLIVPLINGAIFPCMAIMVSEMINTLAMPGLVYYDAATSIYSEIPLDRAAFEEKIVLWSMMYLVIGAAAFILNFIQFWVFTRLGEGLTLRIRNAVYKKMLYITVDWFDEPQNNPGTLVSRLASDAQIVNSLTSTVLGLLIQTVGSIIAGAVIGFIYCWELTLVVFALFPLIMITGMLNSRRMEGFSSKTDEAYKDSGKFLQEAVTNIRTVKSFGHDQQLCQLLDAKLKEPESLTFPKARTSALLGGISSFILMAVNALVFWVGAKFMEIGVITDPKAFFTCMFAVMFAAQGAGQNNQQMGDVGAAMNAAKNLFSVLDQVDELQKQDLENGPRLTDQIKGEVDFVDVYFQYPTRAALVLKGVSFHIPAGTKNAFVGPSGCGKSTIMQIIQRFYDIQSGEVLLDGKNIKDYDLQYLRSCLGVVSQEPVVFNGTIRENIVYNTKDVEEQQIVAAAEKANALKFIENNDFQVIAEGPEEDQTEMSKLFKKKQKAATKGNNPQKIHEEQMHELGSGFNRQVGSKGTQISGGQKQRLAIARVVLKTPNLLLLDEATSALDAENETIVQQSLDKIMEEGTSIAIAHRISTIKDSQQIFVMEDGRIKEQGNYQTLTDMKGYFYRLERGES